eukprot:TRINITY_DN8997_c0_g1_i10.p2 TRINITY_DN8997_c0_g1~~TRINITY_DN8997_c0_g1_i10.p2  ORF type:complete len:307 (-),score=98.40 TRINITY_DN8997_c0_g1_i10:150-1070(-)
MSVLAAVCSRAAAAAGCVPYMVLDSLPRSLLQRYRIRGPTRPSTSTVDWKRTLMLQLTTLLLYIAPGVGWQLATHGPWLYYTRESPMCLLHCDGKALLPKNAPGVLECLFHVAASLVLFDLCYFSWHKTHHQRRCLYKYIHALHHEYHAPFVLVTQYAHPAEIFAVSVFSMLVPIALGAHPLSQWLWLLLSVHISLEAHTGYEMPFAFEKLLLFDFGLGGAIHHDQHHQWPSTNLQPFFTYMDRWCRTDYESSKFAQLASKEQQTPPPLASKQQGWRVDLRYVAQYCVLVAVAVVLLRKQELTVPV